MPHLSPLLRLSRRKPHPTRIPTTATTALRALSITTALRQNLPSSPGEPPRYNFYRTHGRAFFKAFTLAFLTMQIVQWGWLVFETEQEKDAKNAQVMELESEIRLLDEGRGTHRLRAAGEEKEETEP